MTHSSFLMGILGIIFTVGALADQVPEVITSPSIEDHVLHLEGPIDSHMYDYLSYEYKALKTVKVVSLNSYGGRIDWALKVAQKLRGLKIETRLEKGSICASACVFVFAAGQNRTIHPTTWLGIHGARFTQSGSVGFRSTCFVKIKNQKVFNEELQGCSEDMEELYDKSYKGTMDGFNFLESNGVSLKLRETYLGFQDDPLWPYKDNIFRKPDWKISPEDAFQYNLATSISPL